jgi:hypothetical protein
LNRIFIGSHSLPPLSGSPIRSFNPPRRRWYTNPHRQPVLHCPKCTWLNEYPYAPTPAPFFPDLSSTATARPSFPAVAHMSHYADLSRGARARSKVQCCWSNCNHSIGLDPVNELSSFPLVPCPECGMARVVEGRTQKEGENHNHLYFKCARNSVSSLLCFPNMNYGPYVLLICSTQRIVDFIVSIRSISRC